MIVDILHENKVENKKALFDVKCAKALEDELIRLGVKPVEYRTGNSYTRAKSAEGNYPLGGEYSGHLYFTDRWPGLDSGLYNGLRMLEILSKTNLNFSFFILMNVQIQIRKCCYAISRKH